MEKEDYEEPCCVLKKPSKITEIPVYRIMEKLDSYFDKNDLDGAEKHLEYWANEAKLGLDDRGLLTLANEQIGLYRKLSDASKGKEAIKTVLNLISKLGLEDSLVAGTSYVNAATAYKAFGEVQKALPLYESAKKLYEDLLPEGDMRLAGLYNNAALAYTEIGDYGQAEELFLKALEIDKNSEDGKPEAAITHCNLADLYYAKLGAEQSEEKVRENLETAKKLLDEESGRKDGHYAFVLEKCASAFDFYGYFVFARDYIKRAEEIYERA